MTTVTLAPAASAFSPNPTWTVEQYHQALIASITTSTTSSNVVLGQVGGTTPASNVGPWLSDTAWYVWNGSAYVPSTIKVGGATYQVTLAGTPTANRTITLQDKDGTLATLDDIRTGQGTTTLSGTSVTVDWSLSDSFALSLSGNTTVAMSNSQPGQVKRVAIYNSSTHTVTWSGVAWPSGSAPVQTTGGKSDIYILSNIGGSIFGRFLQNY